MGLDNYASRQPDEIDLTDEDRRAFDLAGIDLCGGMLSGDDGSSFRGKVYLDVVDRVADVYLGTAWLTPEEVREIAAAFDRCDPGRVVEDAKGDHHPIAEAEVFALRRFFAVCADRGLGLIGWW